MSKSRGLSSKKNKILKADEEREISQIFESSMNL
jgi:hypothetical protein